MAGALELDCLGAVRTYGNVGDLDSNLLLYEGDVALEGCRKILGGLALCKVFLPALELLVDRLDLGEGVERNLVRLLSVYLVGNCNLDGV